MYPLAEDDGDCPKNGGVTGVLGRGTGAAGVLGVVGNAGTTGTKTGAGITDSVLAATDTSGGCSTELDCGGKTIAGAAGSEDGMNSTGGASVGAAGGVMPTRAFKCSSKACCSNVRVEKRLKSAAARWHNESGGPMPCAHTHTSNQQGFRVKTVTSRVRSIPGDVGACARLET